MIIIKGADKKTLNSNSSHRMAQALAHHVARISSHMHPQTVAKQMNLIQVYVKILFEPNNEISKSLYDGLHVFNRS